MSYEIVYDKAFIKANEIIIPTVLIGSNNCTMYIGGKEILERSWSPLSEKLIGTPENILSFIDERIKEYDGNPMECFKYHSKWVGENLGGDTTSYRKFIENGIKSAFTLEEYGRGVDVALHVYPQNGESKKYLTDFIRTSEALIDWLEKADYMIRQIRSTEPKAGIYRNIAFSGNQPIKKPATNSGAVIGKKGNSSYVYDYVKDKSLSFSNEIEKAIVFDSIDEAYSALGRWAHDMRFISAKNKEKPKNKTTYAVICDMGYVKKISSRRMFFTQYPQYARKFSSEAEANKYVEKVKLSWPESKVGAYHVTSVSDAV